MEMPFGSLPHLYDFGLGFFGFKRGLKSFVSRMPISLPERPSILDVGCGSGAVTFALAELFPDAQVYAFDFDYRMIGKMAELMEKERNRDITSRIFYGWGNILKPETACFWNKHWSSTGLPKYPFDLITTGAVLEYVSPLSEALQNLARLIRPGGYLVDMGMRNSWSGRVFGRVHDCPPYDKDYKIEQFERAGFRDVRIVPFTLWETPVNWSRMGYIAQKNLVR